MNVCALRFSDKALERILDAGGKVYTFDQLAQMRPTGSKTILLRGRISARKSHRYHGKAGVPNSHTRPRTLSTGVKFERSRGRRPGKGYRN